MKSISHRGNINGPNPKSENDPSYINYTIRSGWEVEVDIRFKDNNFFLGHDTAMYPINKKWILDNSKYIWFHCKNLESAYQLNLLNYKIKYFCHTSDPYILVSSGHIWVHDLSLNLNDICIIPLISKTDIENFSTDIVYGICTDFVNLI